MSDLYYQPEKHGLTVVAEIEWSEASYEFDMTVLWQTVDGSKWYVAEDSGCSCPSPFEDTEFKDLIEIKKLQDLIDFLNARKVNTETTEKVRIDGEIATMISKYIDLK